MRRVRSLTIFAITLILPWAALAATGSAKPAEEHEKKTDIKLEQLLEKAKTDPATMKIVRIEAEGRLGNDLFSLVLYGAGVGIANNSRQFAVSPKTLTGAVELVLDSGFTSMPDRFGMDEEEGEVREGVKEKEKKDHDNPRRILRMLTVAVGDQSKTVIQDDLGDISKPLSKAVTGLVALCQEPIKSAVTVPDLAEGLKRVAAGTLAPETLFVAVNAPQIRSMAEAKDQGWAMAVEHGGIMAHTQTLQHGIGRPSRRRLTADEARSLARMLLKYDVPKLPRNISSPGYCQLTVSVLGHQRTVLVRPFAGARPAGEPANAAKFAALRKELYALFKKEIKK
ncbi:MAG: hypothetical protein LJE95_10355 [Acidobacteria bacterium]|nr:hypothetical protein [Acidobacteriota bacterium]